MSTRGARALRGLIVAIASLLVASVAHLSGGGRIGAIGFALAFAFSSLAAIALSGRTVSWVRMSAAVLFSQGVFHVLFGIGTGTAQPAVVNPSAMTMPGMEQATSVNSSTATGLGAVAGMTDNGWMWAAHAAAAVVTILALVHGERTFWRLVGWVAYVVRRIASAPDVAPLRRITVAAAPTHPRVTHSVLLLSGLGRRGPPALLASR